MTDWLGHYSGVGSALAGLDMSMPGDGAVPLFGDSYWGSQLSRSVLNGSVPVDRLNDMVCDYLSGFHSYLTRCIGHTHCCHLVQKRTG